MPEALVRDAALLGRLRAALGALVAIGGAVSFCGWALDRPRLTDWFDEGVSIQPNPSLLLVLSGGALVLLQIGRHRTVAALGAVIAVIAALTLAQYPLGIDFGFNHPLTFGRPWGHAMTVTPGRMGPPASTSFTLIGVAFLLLGLRPESPRVRRFVPRLAIAVCVVAALSVIGYLLSAAPFYAVPWLTAIALQTALMLLALAVAIVLCVPEHEPLRLLLADSGAGALARRILPALVVLPPLLGWIRIKGQAFGYYDQGTGLAMLILAITILGVGLMWLALLALARHEAAERASARALLREQQLATDTLRDADRRKDEFLAILAHELRGPLAPLRNAVEVLKRADDDSFAPELARAIMSRQLSHLARLVDELLDVSRIARDRIEIRKEKLELGALLGACVAACRPAAKEKAQELTLELPAVPIRLEADAVRLAQVFNNILQNASNYTGRGGRIRCSAELQEGEVVVRIADTGIGIDADRLDSVFEMFTQLEPGPDSMRSGLGIGLTLARKFAELHGGSISAKSAGRGQGSEFAVWLPAPAAPAGEAKQPAAAPANAGCRRFLVVDDNVDAASSLALLLRFAGHEVETAYDGLAAIEAFAALRPHAVLLDLGLPHLDGYETCRRIRGLPGGGSTVIVALTGWGQAADRERSRQAGFDRHLVKPVDFESLMEVVAPLLSRPAAHPGYLSATGASS